MTDSEFSRRSEREAMVRDQIAARAVRDSGVLDAMRAVPREAFVAPETVEFAYEDTPLPIGADQTISQPYIVALMIEALRPEPHHRVLEVGAGSGYAAGVLSRMVDQVFAVERHHSLAVSAAQALEKLGYDNVTLRHGNGVFGWEEKAPFAAILVSAGGTHLPPALADQLADGGRMVIPLGQGPDGQELRLFRKRSDGSLDEENLGPVRFVPLVGTVAESGGDTGVPPKRSRASGDLDLLRGHVRAFESAAEAVLDEASERMAGHRTILLGEASHGTSDFYRLRERLTRALIERRAVDFVAVEADWPDAAYLDRYVRGVDTDADGPRPFLRFPRWMWANEETLGFLRWLRHFNRGIRDPEERVGFFGLDLYSLNTSIRAVLDYLDDKDPTTARLARARFACLTPWESDPATYGRLATSGLLEACEDDVVRILGDLLEKRQAYEEGGAPGYMDAVANARLVANAERYYRMMYRSPSGSWNLRDQHMFDTLQDLLGYHGTEAAAAVWAHNSHLGDASATDMGAAGKHNVGQLCREAYGSQSYAVGMGTHAGTVMAAHDWDGAGEVMEVRPSLPGSYERLCHDVEAPAFWLPLREEHGAGEARRALTRERLQRAIGVVYRPETERMSHYYHAALPRQFDEWIFLDRTSAVMPLDVEVPTAQRGGEAPPTYPFAV